MRTILLSIFIIISIKSYAQLSVVSSIMKIEMAVNAENLSNPCTFQYIDSIKFKHPYMTDGQGMGVLKVKINKNPESELIYNIVQYSNKDLITKQLFKLYSLLSANRPSPFRSYFFIGKNLFFILNWSGLDEDYKNLSVKIFEKAELYKKNKD